MQTHRYVNFEFLEQLTEGDNERKQFYVSTFIDEVMPLINQITVSCSEQEWEQVRKIAHTLKPQLHYVGAVQTEKLVISIEGMIAEASDRRMLKLKINQLKTEVEIIISELQSELLNLLKR